MHSKKEPPHDKDDYCYPDGEFFKESHNGQLKKKPATALANNHTRLQLKKRYIPYGEQ